MDSQCQRSLKPGQEVEAKIIGFENNKITLSIKQLLPPPEVVPAEDLLPKALHPKDLPAAVASTREQKRSRQHQDKKERKPLQKRQER
jgi:predicted RNA-binding protein with RPS1 domain